MTRLEFRAMGCQMLAMVDSQDSRAEKLFALVPTWFQEWEQSLSRFRADSELNRLNANAGHDFHASEILGAVLEQALIAARISDGLVVPTVLNAVEHAGYDRSFELLQLRETLSTTSSTPIPDWRAIEYDAESRIVRMPQGVRLDLGGIAKGWAADQAVQRLSEFAPALVDAGGDIAISGPMTNGDAWHIAVADPFDAENDIERLTMDAGGVATSGRDYRSWKIGDQVLHHLIDPRTGKSAETDVMGATVIAPNASQAEVAAKVALILGSRAGMRWLDARPLLAGLLVLQDRRVIKSARLDDALWRESFANAPSYLIGS